MTVFLVASLLVAVFTIHLRLRLQRVERQVDDLTEVLNLVITRTGVNLQDHRRLQAVALLCSVGDVETAKAMVRDFLPRPATAAGEELE